MTAPAPSRVAYRIETRRLCLRCPEPADAPAQREAIASSLEHLRRWLPWAMDEPMPVEARVEWLRQSRARFDTGQDQAYVILDRDGKRVLGGTGLHPRVGEGAREIGYWVRRDATGRGYATEATAALVRVGFEWLDLDRIEIHCDPSNTASAAIPRRLGFLHEATLRRREIGPDGAPRDTMIWTLFASAYPSSPAARAADDVRAYDVMGRPLS